MGNTADDRTRPRASSYERVMDLICVSDQPWRTVADGFKAILEAAVHDRRVFFIENWGGRRKIGLGLRRSTRSGVHIITCGSRAIGSGSSFVDLINDYGVTDYVLWMRSSLPVHIFCRRQPALTILDATVTAPDTTAQRSQFDVVLSSETQRREDLPPRQVSLFPGAMEPEELWRAINSAMVHALLRKAVSTNREPISAPARSWWMMPGGFGWHALKARLGIHF